MKLVFVWTTSSVAFIETGIPGVQSWYNMVVKVALEAMDPVKFDLIGDFHA